LDRDPKRAAHALGRYARPTGLVEPTVALDRTPCLIVGALATPLAVRHAFAVRAESNARSARL
jgi:hypothetical protein